MQENELDETEITLMKKNIIDALDADYYDRMQALDRRFSELKVGVGIVIADDFQGGFIHDCERLACMDKTDTDYNFFRL